VGGADAQTLFLRAITNKTVIVVEYSLNNNAKNLPLLPDNGITLLKYDKKMN